MVSPYDFETPLGYLSENTTPDGRDIFVKKVISTRRSYEPDIYDRIIVADSTWSRFLVSLATIVLVILFMYAYYVKEPDQRVMIYGSIGTIGALVASGLGL